MRWLGHAGFRLELNSGKDIQSNKVIYIDPWLDNPHLPEDLKGKVPEDADVILVTHGHFDHSSSAPAILKASKKEGVKIVSNFELIKFYQSHH